MPCSEGNNDDHDLLETSVLLFGGIALVCTFFCMDLWQKCGKPGMCMDSGGFEIDLALFCLHSAKEI